MTVYRIAKWESVFERAESRKLKQLNWVAMPIGFTSTGYQSMLDEFGDDASSIYGAWCALTAIAASCAVRGILGNSRGNPLKLSHIARMTGFQSAVFEKLFAWAAKPEVGWLELVPAEELAKIYSENAVFPENQAPSGKSTEASGDSRGNSPDTHHNITGHNKTGQSSAAEAAAECELGDLWGNPLIASRFHSLDPEEVTRQANRLLKVAKSLTKDFIWQACYIGEVLSSGMISEVCTKIASGDVRKPKGYIESALRKESEKLGYDWKDLIPLVPKPVMKEPANA